MARWQNVLEIIGVTTGDIICIMNLMTDQHCWYGFNIGRLACLMEDDALLVEIQNLDGDLEAIRQDPSVKLVIHHRRANIADVVTKPTLVRRIA